MDQVRLGTTGLHVSRVCLGMMSYGDDSDRPWVLDEAAAEPIVRRAVEGGVTFFDTADIYSAGASEVATGRLLRGLIPRDEVVVATKVCGPMHPGPNGRGLSRKHILSAIDASLQRLEMDYVDLYQIHRWDPLTPIEEVMEALHDIVRAGKARYIGASSMWAWQFAKAQRVAERHGWTPFVSMQNHLNLVYREEEREMLPLCLDEGVGVIPWSPLGRGFLTGTRTRDGAKVTTRAQTDTFGDGLYERPEDFDVVDRLVAVAGEAGLPPAQVALAWLLAKPEVTAPIVGATKLAHLEDAIAAADVVLTPDQLERLDAGYVPRAADAAHAVSQLEPWIAGRLAELDAVREDIRARGDVLPYLGRTLAVRREPGRTRVHRRGDDLLVPQDDGGAALERWLRRAARDEIAPRVQRAAAAVGVPVTGLSIRDQRTRWGSCSSTGALSFSWRLVLAPEDVLDYVVWHEACHLRVMDHSPRFWALVARHCPDHAAPRRWLREHGSSLRLAPVA